MKHLLPILLLVAVAASTVAGQTEVSSPTPQPADTTKQDSTLHAPNDSVHFVIPIFDIGAIEPYDSTTSAVSRDDIIWKDYRSLYDVLAAIPGVFIRDLSSPGQADQIVIQGVDDKNIGVMVDGILYNDAFTGTFNLWNIPVESIEKIEFITGPSSSFYDQSAAGGMINITTRNYFNNRARTKLRYSQGVNSYVQTDAEFAQNVMRNLNLSFGLTHYGFGINKTSYSYNYNGRFENSNDEAWAFRSKVRYDASNSFNIIFSNLYNTTFTCLFGGVNYYTSPSLFNELDAIVQNGDAYEKLFNNQTTVTAAVKPAEDSSHLITLSGYYFDRLREYRDEENRASPNGIFTQINFRSYVRGATVRYAWTTEENRFSAYADNRTVDRTGPSRSFTHKISSGIKDNIHLFNSVSVTGFSNILHNGFTYSHAHGGEIETDPIFHFSFFSGYSATDRVTFSTYTGGRMTNIDAGMKIHFDDAFDASITVSRRTMNDPVVIDTISFADPNMSHAYYRPGKYHFDGISAYAHCTWNDFHVEGTANYLKQPDIVRGTSSLILYPEVTLDGSIYYRGLLAKGHLDMKAGFRGRFYSSQTGMKPFDETGVWLPSDMLSYGPSGTVDFFFIGKIGDAYIHFIWENLAGTQYLLSPVYPMYGRNIRFGVSWEFLD